MKRLISLVLIVVLLCGSFTALAESFSGDAERVPFLIASDINPATKHLTAEVPYSDDLFEEEATTYHHTLAQASMGLSFSNFRDGAKTPEEQGYGIRDFLTGIGFTDLQADQYDVDTTSDTVASMIARKETVIGGEKTTLIAVSICGFGYKNEWLSNFTFSGDEHHAGFDNAADKVLGRLLLYLYNHPAQSRLKIWISGFSRAAAISNLLGQKLSNEKLCPVEDLYVYTFATPNTAIAESPWPCPSIFNIVGSFDPVPTVPPAEWGYGRYGTTLFLPAQEVDSNYLAHRAPVEKIYEELTGIAYWNNPNCNWLLQKMLQIVYSSVQSAEIYNSFVRGIISGLWVTGGILPRIRLLSDLMTADAETDASIRSLSDSVKNVLSPFLYNLLAHSGGEESRYWGEGVSVLAQVMHEHFPDVYYSWMMSTEDPEDLFLLSPSYCRISLLPGMRVDSIERIDGTDLIPAPGVASMAFEDNAILNIPRDYDYLVTLTAERDIRDEMVTFSEYTVPSLETNATFTSIELDAGEKAYLVVPKPGSVEYPKPMAFTDRSDEMMEDFQTFVDRSYENVAAVLEYYDSGWLARNLIDLLLWVPVLLLCILVFVVIRVNIHKKQKSFNARRAFLIMIAVFFALDQALYNLFPWGVLLIIVCQGICSLSAALISFFAWRNRRDRYTLLLFPAMLCWTLGDIITRTSSAWGTAFFGLGHVILCFAFCLESRPSRRQMIILTVSVLMVLVMELLGRQPFGDLLLSLAYAVSLLAMAVLSSNRGKMTMAGGILFLASDFLLVLLPQLNSPAWLIFLSMGSYYLAVIMISSAAYGETK